MHAMEVSQLAIIWVLRPSLPMTCCLPPPHPLPAPIAPAPSLAAGPVCGAAIARAAQGWRERGELPEGAMLWRLIA